MSKVIEPTAFLSDFDRQYLIARGKNPDDYILPAEEAPDEVPPYSEWAVADLKREVDQRNAERELEADHIAPTSGKKADLIVALEADDANVVNDDA